ncbi:MAG TPA: Rrf2 family transcriptional regulator [Candidatus Acidoferrales bacterium]|nr:Rrf2 family transcriptional regulator [Candidatus Acidoferrales bacterium]
MMQVSRKVDYALRAVIYLSAQNGVRPVSVKEIAARRRIPRKFLEKIIQDLIRADLVKSHRGAHGGYTLTRQPHDVSFRDVIEAVEGPISLNVCVTEQHDCSVLSSCNMQRIWQEGQRRMLEYFSDTTLADLAPSFLLNTRAEAGV